MAEILIVEDELSINELIRRNLNLTGHHCTQAFDGLSAVELLENGNYDLLVLDIMLPEVNGYELLEYIKPMGIPVIFLTAKGAVRDRIQGLKMGADDYIVEPFEPEELRARIHCVLRRYKSVIRLPDIKIDTRQRSVTLHDQPVHLTLKEYELLLYLAENGGTALSRGQILANVWESDDEDTRTVDLHIQRLRKKLNLEKTIQTLPKIGYRFEV